VITVVTVTETTVREVVVIIGTMTGNVILVVLELNPRIATRILSGGDKILLPLAAEVGLTKKTRVFDYVRTMATNATIVNTMSNADIFRCSIPDMISW